MKKILIVDDIPMNVLLLRKILAKAGFQADSASNGLEALKMARHHNYDLILLDMMMPVMDGLETARLLRETLALTRIVLISAADPHEVPELVHSEHVDEFIHKGNHFKSFSDRILRLV